MSCRCGDTNCPSCGPALGSDPAFDTVCSWLMDDVLVNMPPVIDAGWLAEELANRLGYRERTQEFADAVYAEARRWEKKQRDRV